MLAADVLQMIAEHVKPGVTTNTLDKLCHDYIVNQQHGTADHLFIMWQSDVAAGKQKASKSAVNRVITGS